MQDLPSYASGAILETRTTMNINMIFGARLLFLARFGLDAEKGFDLVNQF